MDRIGSVPVLVRVFQVMIWLGNEDDNSKITNSICFFSYADSEGYEKEAFGVHKNERNIGNADRDGTCFI